MNTILYIVVEFALATITTIKYVVTVKSSPFVAALISTLAATIGGIGTKLLTSQPMWVIIATLIGTNLAGVLFGRFIVDKCTKDRLWVFDATIKADLETIGYIRAKLRDAEIHSVYETIVNNSMYELKVFSESRANSKLIKELLNATKNCKYHIIESR